MAITLPMSSLARPKTSAPARSSDAQAIRGYFDLVVSQFNALDPSKRELLLPASAIAAFDSRRPLWILPEGDFLTAFGGHNSFFDFIQGFLPQPQPELPDHPRGLAEALIESGIGYVSRHDTVIQIIVGPSTTEGQFRAIGDYLQRTERDEKYHIELRCLFPGVAGDSVYSGSRSQSGESLTSLHDLRMMVRQLEQQRLGSDGSDYLSASTIPASGGSCSIIGRIRENLSGFYWDPEGGPHL